jgi:dihydrofolate reductase
MLMGRGTYEYFAHVMPEQTGPYADAINAIRMHVLSQTLESADWNNSAIIRDDVVPAVSELKQQDGADLMMYGRGRLSQALLEHHLVDEIRFSVHPVLVGARAAAGGNDALRGQTEPVPAPGYPPAGSYPVRRACARSSTRSGCIAGTPSATSPRLNSARDSTRLHHQQPQSSSDPALRRFGSCRLRSPRLNMLSERARGAPHTLPITASSATEYGARSRVGGRRCLALTRPG